MSWTGGAEATLGLYPRRPGADVERIPHQLMRGGERVRRAAMCLVGKDAWKEEKVTLNFASRGFGGGSLFQETRTEQEQQCDYERGEEESENHHRTEYALCEDRVAGGKDGRLI